MRNVASSDRRNKKPYAALQSNPSGEEYRQDRLKYLRAAAASALVDAAIDCFQDRREDLLKGGFKQNLLDATIFASDVKAIRKACSETIYNETKKLQLEAAGFGIIMTVMDLYGHMLLRLVDSNVDSLNMRERGLYELLPRESRDMLTGADHYVAMLTLTDYISGMSDRYIRDLYQKITGTSPTIGRMM